MFWSANIKSYQEVDWKRLEFNLPAANSKEWTESFSFIVEQGMRYFVESIARGIKRRYKRASYALDLDDLRSEGKIALIQALNKYDPAYGVSFISYAYPRIRGAMIDAIRQDPGRSMIRVGQPVMDKIKKINGAAEYLTGLLGRRPAAEEVAEFLGNNAGEIVEAQAATSLRIRVDPKEKDYFDNQELLENQPDERRYLRSIEESFGLLIKSSIEDFLRGKRNPQRYRYVLYKYLGLLQDDVPCTQRAIAEKLGITETAVSFMLGKYKRFMATPLRRQWLEAVLTWLWPRR
jgi:RNA polymerase sigma factor for flagellar operon FliA